MCVGAVDGRTKFGAEVRVADISNDSDDGSVGFGARMGVFYDQVANGILRRAEEAFGEGQVDDCDFGRAFNVGCGEFAADKNRLAQGSEVAGSDIGRFESAVFVFGEGVAFDGVTVHLAIAREFGVVGGCDRGDAGNQCQ